MFCADVLDVSDLGNTHKYFPRVHMPAADDRAQHFHDCVCVYSQGSVPQSRRPLSLSLCLVWSAPVFPLLFVPPLCLPAASFEVFSLSLLFLLRSHLAWSQWEVPERPLRSTALPLRGRRVGTAAHSPPFNLLLCCY